MTPVSLNPPEGPSLLQAGQNQFCISPNNQDPRAFFNIFDPRRQTIEINGGLRDQNDHQDHKLVLHEGSSSNHQLYNSSFNSAQPAMHDPRTARGPNLSYSRMEEEDSKSGHGSAKWMSSKMRLMKKMMRPSSSPATHKAINSTTTTSPRFQNHRYGNRYSQRNPRNNNNSNNTTRVCSDCKTSTTPLWRSGPLGPKSLCNACGIRQRKARRAMMEAENGLATPMNATSTKTRVHNKVKKPRTNHFAQFKNNKYKFTTATTASSSSEGAEEKVECFATNLRNNSDFQEAFTWDEKVVRAALLLMDLSCGLVHSN